jgi:DNA uptake protein ComE-like DNA-binding protein
LTEVYGKVFVHANLNTATDEEILSVPAAQPNRILREFKEYRPYTSMDQFHREMRKYWDEKEVNRLQRYVTLN